MAALLFEGWLRTRSAAKQSVDDRARLEQIDECGESVLGSIRAGDMRLTWDLHFIAIGPTCWNQRATAVWKHDEQLQYAASTYRADDFETAALKRMPLAQNCYPAWNLAEMGSVSPCSSTGSTMTC
jgi:hypothetical protein